MKWDPPQHPPTAEGAQGDKGDQAWSQVRAPLVCPTHPSRPGGLIPHKQRTEMGSSLFTLRKSTRPITDEASATSVRKWKVTGLVYNHKSPTCEYIYSKSLALMPSAENATQRTRSWTVRLWIAPFSPGIRQSSGPKLSPGWRWEHLHPQMTLVNWFLCSLKTKINQEKKKKNLEPQRYQDNSREYNSTFRNPHSYNPPDSPLGSGSFMEAQSSEGTCPRAHGTKKPREPATHPPPVITHMERSNWPSTPNPPSLP